MSRSAEPAQDEPRLRVLIRADDRSARTAVLVLAEQADVSVVADPDPPSGTVLVAVGATVESALGVCQSRMDTDSPPVPAPPVLIVAKRFSPSGTRRAVRMGIQAMFACADATPVGFAAAVRAAHRGEGWMPHAVLDRLLSRTAESRAPAPLTARQTAVLALMAEGYGNAAIAEALSCSEHTVKNTIFEVMARLQVRNRAHAVARGLRAGLI